MGKKVMAYDGQYAAYTYRPVRFYVTVFALTWLCWLGAILAGDGAPLYLFMLAGLVAPAAVAVMTVCTSGNAALKRDFRRKLTGFYRLRPLSLMVAVTAFAAVVAVSILISLLFGEPTAQFSFTEDFSFSVGGSSALLTILLASCIEELGWRGYGEDAVGAYHTWFTESIVFGCVWAAWHLPLFFVDGTYQSGLRELGTVYVVNFLVGAIPLDFFQTWVYVKNRRSMLATILFHLAVNVMQEKIAMTPRTKIIETFVITAAAVIVVLANRNLFFERHHIGRLLEEDV